MEKQKLIIKKPFGPLQPMELEIDDVMIFIGEQATGKSTVAKLVYFFRRIIIEEFFQKSISEDKNFFSQAFIQNLKRSFLNLFPRFEKNCEIIFHYAEECSITIKKNKLNFEIKFSNTLSKDIEGWLVFYEEVKLGNKGISIPKFVFNRLLMCQFIPAGRNIAVEFEDLIVEKLLASEKKVSDQFNIITRQFLSDIISLKSEFKGLTFDKIIEREISILGDRNNIKIQNLSLFQKRAEKILKAKYSRNGDGEKLLLSNGDFVFLNEASSGQQEVVRILQSLFYQVMSSSDMFLIIEEPEAHLYPTAQKKLAELLALVVNATGSQIFITTHSPYFLTSFNNLLFAHKMGKVDKDTASKIVNEKLWLAGQKFAAYSLGHNQKTFCQSIFNKETGVIAYNKIDDVSEEIAGEFDALIDIQLKTN